MPPLNRSRHVLVPELGAARILLDEARVAQVRMVGSSLKELRLMNAGTYLTPPITWNPRVGEGGMRPERRDLGPVEIRRTREGYDILLDGRPFGSIKVSEWAWLLHQAITFWDERRGGYEGQ